MHIVRVCIRRPGDTAERIVTRLADRRAVVIVTADPRVTDIIITVD